MRSFGSRKAAHGRVQARQNVPDGPAIVPRQAFSYEGEMTLTSAAAQTATELIFDKTAVPSYAFPSALPRVSSRSSTVTPTSTSSTSSITDAASTTATALSADATTAAVIDPAQQVYDGIANMALHSLPPAVIGIASGGSALIVLLALYCFICRWYYRRLPRSTKRWDVDDRAKKEVYYDDKPRYSPKDDEAPHMAEDDRRGVAVGDSYFPQGETWQKFEGRTAHHPESFIYTGPGLPEGMGPPSPGSPGGAPHYGAGLARPRPQFAQGGGRRGPIESVFSNVSFPTTHRADSIRHSFYPEGYEHDGEVWDLASPGIPNDAARPSFDSSFRSINRASIFGEMSGRARGSVVVYESQPAPRSLSIADDPFAGPGDSSPRATSFSADRYAGKKSFDNVDRYAGKKSFDNADRYAGKKSFEGKHARARSRDVRALGTLAEDGDESSSQGHGSVTPAKHSPRERAI